MMRWFLTTLAPLISAATPILRQYGIRAAIAILFVESMGVVFAPDEAVIVAACFLAAKGVFPIWEAIPVGALSATLDGYLAYGLGARYGHAGLLCYGCHVWIRPEIVDKVHRFFWRFGAPVELSAALSYHGVSYRVASREVKQQWPSCGV